MNQPTIFSSGQELASLVVSSGVLRNSWDAISQVSGETINPTLPSSSSIRYNVVVKQQQNSQNIINGGATTTIIAFVSSSPCTSIQEYLQGQEGQCLVSSEALGGMFEFVSTKSNPSFSLHRAAVALFSSIKDDLSLLKQQYGNTNPLIITGHSIGGSVASLFTLWLLKTISPTARKRPICITFGSPLLGDNCFQQAILERPLWNSCFLHVASNQDLIPKLFAAPLSVYKPFGTFLLCSESGYACFEESESVLELMVAIGSNSLGNHGSSENVDYGQVLGKLKCAGICRGVSEVAELHGSSPLQAGIVIQMIESVKCDTTQRIEESGEVIDLVKRTEKRSKKLLLRSRRSVFDPKKKLNDMKINMTYLEWYKKQSVDGGGYYDVFKNVKSRSREEIVKRKNILTQYWHKEVKEAEKRPQMEGAHFHMGWLYGGTNYRRMVEPLDIAEWYKKGNKNYLAVRSEHYSLLEEWVSRDARTSGHRNDRACSLTEDSCFWAHVEEAKISCQVLKAGGHRGREFEESLREDLTRFENYVKELINNFAVSTEIFLKQSSFMLWWENYEEIIDSSYSSWLVDFMRNRKYELYC